MIKKYERRLNLKSDVYREKSVTPVKNSLRQSMRNTDRATHKFNEMDKLKVVYNTCCPNCKYLFKFSVNRDSNEKSNGLSQQLIEETINQRMEQQRQKMIDTWTQTDKKYLDVRASPKKQNFASKIQSLSPESYKFNNTESKSPIFQKNKRPKLGYQYPSRSMYMKQERQQTPPKINHSYTTYSPIPNQKTPYNMLNTDPILHKHENDITSKQKQLNIKQANQLIQQIYLSSDLLQVLNHQTQMMTNQQQQVSSICKMMLIDSVAKDHHRLPYQ